jgi:SAM-dependent methyltransferase
MDPLDPTHEDKVKRWLGGDKLGVEIGAFIYPIPGIKPLYVDCFREFGNQPVRADYYGHASFLPFRDNSLDYVVACHVLEHVANPVAAFAEWYRVLRPGGIIYLVVPDRRFNWDHPRPLTSVEHMLDDFSRGITACDETHIDGFAYGVDWASFSPSTPAEDVPMRQKELAKGMHEAAARGEEINIHFHVFEPLNLLALIDKLGSWPATRLSWTVIDTAERFPAGASNGFLTVIQVRKRFRDRLSAQWRKLFTRSDSRRALFPDAEPFDKFCKRCAGTTLASAK